MTPRFIVFVLVIFAVLSFMTTNASHNKINNNNMNSNKITEEQTQLLFTKWVTHYDKTYETSAVLSRYAIFSQNLNMIMQHNAKPGKTFEMGLNQFADMTRDEFVAYVNRGVVKTSDAYMEEIYQSQENKQMLAQMKQEAQQLKLNNAKYINWQNSTGPVRNQGSCGSCVSFSTVSTLTTTVNIRYNTIYTYAPQQIVDCQTLCFGCNGCIGLAAVDYLQHWGVALEQDYPYQGKDGECKERQVVPGPYSLGSKKLIVRGDKELQEALQTGPVIGLLAASSSAFQFYKSGVVSDCDDVIFNHSIQVVGYEMDPTTGLEYYLIQNSWSNTWGENGYIKLVANSGGWKSCGLGLFWDTKIVLPPQ